MIRLVALFSLLGLLPISACIPQEFKATPHALNRRLDPGERYQGIRLLGALRLADAEIGGSRLCGLSGLAWDDAAGVLYAISDRGALFHLSPIFDERGYLSDLKVLAAHPLQNATGKPVSRPFNDSEGLAVRHGDHHRPGDTELLVSFEAKPRLVRYDPTGRWLGEVPLPATLRNVANYRGSNQSLEAVTIDPRWGILTGSEIALRNDPAELIRIFSTRGRFWLYPLGSAPGSALVAMEALPDGGLLTLERAFVSVFQPFTISLRRTELPLQGKSGLLKVDDVAVLDSGQDWLLDNFEGLTRHREQRFFMISDDNCNGWQSTLLAYFELLPFQAGSQRP